MNDVVACADNLTIESRLHRFDEWMYYSFDIFYVATADRCSWRTWSEKELPIDDAYCGDFLTEVGPKRSQTGATLKREDTIEMHTHKKGGFLSAGNLKGSASPVCMPSIGGPHKFSYSDEYISTRNRKFATGLSSFF